MKSVILYILSHLQSKRSVYFVVKTAFIAQQKHLAEYYVPLFVDDIKALQFGPVPSDVYDALKIARGDKSTLRYHESDGLHTVGDAIRFEDERFFAAEEPDLEMLSPSAIKCLDYAISVVENMSFNEVMQTTHNDEWSRAYYDRHSNIMNPLEIAKEGGIDPMGLAYLESQIEIDNLLK